MMSHSFSVCLPILALIAISPSSQAGEVILGGAVHGQVLSDVLHKYFASRETKGKATPLWKPQVEAVMSLMGSMTSLEEGPNKDKTKQSVRDLVTNITVLLKIDAGFEVTAQKTAAEDLEESKSTTQTEHVGRTEKTYTDLKTKSANAKECHENATILQTAFADEHNCTVNDIQTSENEDCDSICTAVKSKYKFALTDAAKALRWCKFNESETAQTCIASLRTDVNETRRDLEHDHRIWKGQKEKCEQNRTKCRRCQPHWNGRVNKTRDCKAMHSGIYQLYADLQVDETAMCNKSVKLSEIFERENTSQTNRVEEWSDLNFVICIFNEFKVNFNFTERSFEDCKGNFTGAKAAMEFYKLAPQLDEPELDFTKVPKCDQDRKNVDAEVDGLDGLERVWTEDGCDSRQVYIKTHNTFDPPVVNGICKV